MSTKDDMLRARDLIKAKRYDEARAILTTIDHPTASDWLDKISGLSSDPIAHPGIYAEPDRSANLTVGATRSRLRLPLLEVILLLLFTAVGGIGVGVLLLLSSRVVYLIFASVIIAAAAGGWIVSLAVRLGKVRMASVAFFFGMLTGLLIYGTYRYGQYLDERQFARDQILAEAPSLKPDEVEQVIDEILVEETGYSGFVGMTLLDAEAGMTIMPTRGSSSAELTLSKELTIAYWGAEILIVTFGAGMVAARATKEGFGQ
jgi:hypothetical protein